LRWTLNDANDYRPSRQERDQVVIEGPVAMLGIVLLDEVSLEMSQLKRKEP
jgi:hypothetical protein